MRESRPSGSVRGVGRKVHLYRDYLFSSIRCHAKDNEVLCQSQIRLRPGSFVLRSMTSELAILVLACAAWLNRAQDRRLRFLLVQNRVLRETGADVSRMTDAHRRMLG